MTVGELFERYHDGLLGYVTQYCGDADMAADAVGQAFAKAVFHLPLSKGMHEAAARAWLYTTARNASIDMARKRRRLVVTDTPPETAHIPGFSGQVELEEALEALPDLRRQIVEMRYLKGYTSVEIGRHFSMPDATVRYHLSMALRQLREYYKEAES